MDSALKKKRKYSKLEKSEWLSGYLFLVPNFLGFMIFTMIPILMGFAISFTNYRGLRGNIDFVGVDNYLRLLRDSQFENALRNNLYYSFTSVPLTLFASLLLALALNKKLPAMGGFKTIYFFPNLTSMVAVGIVWMLIFHPSRGPINQFLLSIGIPQDYLPTWLASTRTALTTIVIVVVWRNAGYFMILFLGGLKNIPSQLYEAAQIDGASQWQSFRHITWPMLSPTTFMVTILCFIQSFQVFDIINVTTEGGPGRSTSVLVFRIYIEGFRDWRMGYASAIAYFLFVLILLFTLMQWRTQNKWVSDWSQ